MKDPTAPKSETGIRKKLHEVIFEADTPAGKLFDSTILILIVLSVATVILESVESIDARFHHIFFYFEWSITIIFTIEYLLRMWIVQRPLKYMTSFYGVVDLLAILPTYLSVLVPGSQYLLTIRALRLLRIFRIFKFTRYFGESQILFHAVRASRPKITVFLAAVVTIVIIIGSAMYFIEGGAESGFTSIPVSMYWAIVTLTTVGFGDVVPVTHLGKILASILMILGYGIIAIPTGIVTSELAFAKSKMENKVNTINCPDYGKEGHDSDAVHCKFCGGKL